MSTGKRQGRARGGAAFIAAVVLLCQAAAWVHGAATPHVTCAEHGESVHLSLTAVDATIADASISAAPREAAAHAHEHCNLQGHRTTVTARAPVLGVALVADVVRTPVPARPLVVAAVLRFAPKTSPPRAPTV